MKNQAGEIYKCHKCNLAIEIASPCGCDEPCLRCCGEKLVPVRANTVDAAREKHVPYAKRTDDGISVQIGSDEHPMTQEHYIVWIEVTAGEWHLRKYLACGEKPAADFKLCCDCKENVKVRAFCNLHGLWECEL